MYVRNAWYVACMPDEIDDEAARPDDLRQSLVLFRGRRARVAALEDFCPHRGAPLSLGRSRDGRMVCGYHGLVMGGDGKLRRHAGPARRGSRRSERFPSSSATVSSGSGRAKRQADPARLHPLPWAESPEWAYGGGLYHIKCDYRLMIDNLMDLTHETYVHATSIGQPEIEEAAPETARRGRLGRSPAASWRTSRRRRSGAWRCAATISPTTCRSTAGRSAASRRRAT